MQIEIRGNTDLRKALKRFTPDLEKALRKELKAALTPVAKRAQSYVPMTSPMRGWEPRAFSEGHFPTYNAATIIRGIKVIPTVSKPNKNGFTSMARIENQSPAGAIYETSGRKNPHGQEWVGPRASGASKKVSRSNNPQAGAQFIKNLGPLTSSTMGQGRLIYRAWAENKGVAYGAAMKAVDKATTEFYARNTETKFRTAA